MGTRRKSSRPRRDRDADLPRPRDWLHQPRRDVCSSRDVIETLKYKFYWLQYEAIDVIFHVRCYQRVNMMSNTTGWLTTSKARSHCVLWPKIGLGHET